MATILVVEDSTTQRLLLKNILEKAGYEVQTARNGHEGLQAIATSPPALVISDIRMPEMDGYEMCWRIKNDPGTRLIPVILLSGLSETEEILLGLEAMADSYIIKPLVEEEILAIVATVNASRERLAAPSPPMAFHLDGQEYQIRSGREQILNFLVSIYDNAVRRNIQLEEIQTQLRIINEQLSERTRELEASENRFRALVQTVPDIIYRIDEEGKFLFVNHSIRKLGYEPEELIGKPFTQLIAPEEEERVARRKVLPRLKGKTIPEGQTPKLFDEKRTGSRRTSGLEVRLLPNPARIRNPSIEIVGELHCFEVNSAGMYQIDHQSNRDHFVGTVGVIRDITERKAIAEALIKAKEEAVRANRAKSAFLSRMSHELRTPLNAVIGFSQLLEFNPLEPLTPGQRESVSQIFSGGKHLLELINGLLDVARIETGRITPEMEILDPTSIVLNAISMSRPLALKRFVSLINTGEEVPYPLVHADPLRLKQVIINLLSNAIKFNRKGGFVIVAHRETGDGELEISVKDSGPGIPREQWNQVFKPFSRLGAEAAGIEGTGIGLNISRGLMEMMGGEIGFESEQDKGCRFWIRLRTADRQSVPLPSSDPGAEVPGGFAGGPRVLLYVEDNPSNARLMRDLVSRMPGLNLLQAKTAEEGIELAREHTPDLIVMDIQLPGMDGIQALTRLNELPETRAIPTIALSGHASPEDVDRGKAAGFLRYLTKPLMLNEFQDVLRELLPQGGNRKGE
ncbi:MAG: response regulator [Magnetococcales bacterium]|nr:response regulator [Magnetococcales bacterium]